MLQSGLLCLTLLAITSAIRCPDGETCNDGRACCLTNSGRYGCCPLTRSLPMVHASPGNDGNDTVCPDGSHCPSEYSCSKSHHVYKCCPLPQGVSCSDGKHCCPEHHRCGEDGHSCVKEKAAAVQALRDDTEMKDPPTVGVTIINCPDGSLCYDFNTCCQLANGSYGCCPFPYAVCCPDHIHCCPSGTFCGVDACHYSGGSVPRLEKVPALSQVLRGAKLRASQVDSVPCSPTKSCPVRTTCCFNKRLWDWGCCPLPKAVCCPDGDYCCPSGYACDGALCVRGRVAIPRYAKTEALANSALPKRVRCDAQRTCAAGSTCCPLPMQQWGCCPLDKAVCCGDMKHCCPSGYTCDPTTGACHQSRQLRWDNSLFRKRLL